MMTYWPQLIQDFTPYVYSEGRLMHIDSSQIAEEWNGREVNVILIGNYHHSGTLAQQTRKFIKTCVNVTDIRERTVCLAEGVELEENDCEAHLLIPKNVRIIGADCRAKGTHRITKEYIHHLRSVEKMIMSMNERNYNELKEIAKTFSPVETEETFMMPTLADFERLSEMFKRWFLEDSLINEKAKELLGPNPVEENEFSGEDVELSGSNLYLSCFIDRYYKEHQMVFVPWGVDHFVKDDSLYKRLVALGIKPLILLPKEENSCDYHIEFARWQEAIVCDSRTAQFSCLIEEEEMAAEQEIPYWMALMLSKVLRSMNLS